MRQFCLRRQWIRTQGCAAIKRAAAQMQNSDTYIVIVGADRKLEAMQALANKLGLSQRVHFTGPLGGCPPLVRRG